MSTVPAALPLSILEGARALGLDVDELARELGLGWDDLRDPDARVPEAVYLDTLDALEQRYELVDFDVMSSILHVEALGALGYAMAAANDLEHALRTLTRFGRLAHEDTVYGCEVSESELWFGRALAPRYAKMRYTATTCVASALSQARKLTGRQDLVPVRVHFQHPRPLEAERYEAFFGAPVEFASEATAIVFPGWAASLPLVRQDPSLFAYLSRHAEALLAHLPPREDALADRVRELVADTLRSGTLTQARVAKRLALSERTLQRRLRDEGTSFAEIVDETRRALAHDYLREPGLAMYEIALLLGYSEPSAFFRAFRRWTGRTPLEFRQLPKSA